MGDWREILAEARQTHPERLELLLPRAQEWLRDARYLPWREFRYRNDSLDSHGDEIKWLWALVKELRTLSGRTLFGANTYPEMLWYVPTVRIQRLCHVLDRHATTEAFYGRFPKLAHAAGLGTAHMLTSFAFEEAIRSSQLEGASTTRVVAEEMLAEKRAPRDQSERMILGNYKMLLRIKELTDAPLSVDMILEIHRAGTDDIHDKVYRPGVLRTTDDVRVMDGDRMVHQPRSSEGLRARLEAICAWYNTPTSDFAHPLVRAIALHFLLAHEHPFYDGNGRTSRALFYWAALREGYAPLRFVSISAALRRAATQYSQSFSDVQQDGFDLTYFIEAQLQVVYEQYQRFESFLQHRRDTLDALQKRWSASAAYQGLNTRRQSILELFIDGTALLWTANAIAEVTHVTHTTALNDLRHLESLGFLASEKKGRALRFGVREA